MACLLTRGFELECREGVGGVKEIFFANWDNFITGVTIDATTGEITDLPAATIYRYQPFRATGSWNEVPTVNDQNGTIYWAQAVALTIGQLSAEKRKELNLLARAKLAVFVRLYSDKILFVGRTDGAFLNGGTWGSGQAKGDLNGYQLEITAEEPNPAEFLQAFTTEPFDNYEDITVSPAYNPES